MCGILGAINLGSKQDVDKISFEKALCYLSHRGPDNQEVIHLPNVLLGHTRLSIIDLDAKSNMPYRDESSGWIITYNGEIFNYLELKDILLERGHSFQTSSDTEVIIKAYLEWGEKCLEHFNGMFAFFLYNPLLQIGFGARDRFGIKPFYYSLKDENFIFSSEIKPLLELGVKPSVNLKYLKSYILTSSLDYGNGTLINEINQIKAGEYFTINKNKISFSSWWTNDNLKIKLPETYNERISEYRKTLTESLKIRLRSDVKLSMTLSGGMDSTSLYSLYKKDIGDAKIKSPIQLYTIKYDNSSTDEVPQVEEITNAFKDKFNAVSLKSATSIKSLRETIYFQEFPAWNLSSITYQEIYKAIANSDSKVLIEGHGNDEILGGYHTHVNLSIRYFLRKFHLKSAWNAAKILSEMTNSDIGQKSHKPWVIILFALIPFSNQIKKQIKLKKFVKLNLWEPNLNLKYIKKIRNKRFTLFQNELLHLMNYQILPTVLRVFDRATMSSSIEMRAPFMDYRLIQIAFSLKDNEKIGGEYQKRILRDSMKGYVPESIRTDKVKKGFTGDLITWFDDPNNQKHILKIISKIKPEMYLNRSEVLNYYNINFQKGFGWEEANILSRIISLVEWWKLFIDEEFKFEKYHNKF